MNEYTNLSITRSPSDPASDAFPVTPSDAAVILTRALYVGVTGNVTVTTVSGLDVQFTAVPAGTILPVRCKKVKATGTTATDIVGLV